MCLFTRMWDPWGSHLKVMPFWNMTGRLDYFKWSWVSVLLEHHIVIRVRLGSVVMCECQNNALKWAITASCPVLVAHHNYFVTWWLTYFSQRFAVYNLGTGVMENTTSNCPALLRAYLLPRKRAYRAVTAQQTCEHVTILFSAK